MTEQNKAESELDRLNGCAVALGFSDVSELVEQTAKDRLLALSRPTQTADAVEAAGLFERTVSHEQARQSAQNLIDAFFKNRDGKGVLATVPARPDNDDIQLVDYIKQQAALSHTATSEVEPVAWRYEQINGGDKVEYHGYQPPHRKANWIETPLYASPPPKGKATKLAAELDALAAAATPGPYRVHDHRNMEQFNGDPDDWIGYAWVGRITNKSRPNGNFDAEWINLDRRKDGCKEYRERASADAQFVAWLCNHVPEILTALQSNSDSELQWCLQQFVNAYQTGMIETPAEETMASVMRLSLATLARLEQGAA